MLAAVVLLVCNACSGGSHQTLLHGPLRPRPSLATQMICETEAKKEIAAGVGVDTFQPLRPTWDPESRTFSCDYEYPGGAKITLSVKETPSTAATSAYFDLLARRLGKKRPLLGPKDATAYVTSDNSIVFRKDEKVLLIDVSKLPPRFGRPPGLTRADMAETVFGIIVGGGRGPGLIN